ncbi:MAG TPA: PilN domain-containing protein [Tepidisphaeraceae bacterium]|nr:PilN domain-containing protein [Tepidisphaeraceae bacterium]
MAHFNDLSFLPEDYLATRRARRANRLFSMLLGIVIVAVAGAFVVADASVMALRSEQRNVTKQYDQENLRLKRINEIRKRHEQIAYRARLADSLIEKLPRSKVLTEITQCLPQGATMLDLSLDTKARPRIKPVETKAVKTSKKPKPTVPAALPEPLVFDQTIKIGGVAYSDLQVAQFMTSLKSSDYFDEVDLIQSKQFVYCDEDVRRFEVSLRLADHSSSITRKLDAQYADGDTP